MRKILLFLLATATSVMAMAERQIYLVVTSPGGSTSYSMDKHPVLTFEGADVKLVGSDISMTYTLDSGLVMTIEERNETDDVQTQCDESIKVSGNEVRAFGAKQLMLYTVDGRLVQSGQPDANGVITISIASLRTGTYLISNGTQNIKIHKK